MGNVRRGLVDCPKLKEKFCKDVSVHSSVMKSCKMTVGDYLAFELHVNAAGDP